MTDPNPLDLVERLEVPASTADESWPDYIDRLHRERREAASLIRSLSEKLAVVEGERGAWELPEIEEDEDGTITVRAFDLSRNRAVSWVFRTDDVLRVESEVGKAARSERLNYIYPTRAQAAEARALSAERERDEAVEALRKIADGTWNTRLGCLTAKTYCDFARETLARLSERISK